MRVLVAGGAGYIGSVVTAALLSGGHEVTVLDDLSTGHADAVPSGATLAEASLHDSAPVLAEVREHSSAVNASTVYRTLEVLEGLGLVRHAHLSDRAPTYHSVSDHEHFHLVCRNCGRIVSVGPGMLTSLTERLRDEQNFVVDVGHLTVFGTCGDCA